MEKLSCLVLVWVLFVAPLPALVVAFIQLWRFPAKGSARTLFTLIAVNYGYLVAAFVWKRALLGADYSDRLFVTVGLGTGLSVLLSVLAFTRETTANVYLGFAALLVGCLWFFVWAINSAV